MGDELLSGTLLLILAQARGEIAAWVEDYNRERPHSALGYATPAAFAAELNKQWPASLRPTGSATQPIASTALMRKKKARLSSPLEESRGSRQRAARGFSPPELSFWPPLTLGADRRAAPFLNNDNRGKTRSTA